MLLFENHDSIVTSLAFSPDGSFLTSLSRDGTPVLRDANGVRSEIRLGYLYPVVCRGVAWFPSGRLLISHEFGWDLLSDENGHWKLDSRCGGERRLAAAEPLSNEFLALGFGDPLATDAGQFEILSLKTNRLIQPTFREPFGVRAVATGPERKLVAWSTGGKEIKVWDITKQTPVTFRTTHVATALALAPDGSAIAAVQDWTVRIHDLKLKQDRAVLKGHKGVVSAVAFSPDGATLATSSWDGTVRFWDPASGQERAAFQWPIGKVFSFAFAPDGLRAAAGGDTGTVVVWDVE